MSDEQIRDIYLKTMKQPNKISVDELLELRKTLFTKADNLVKSKGHDYNKDQQLKGDTLFNLKVCEILGIVPLAERGILVRLSDKLMRLVSLIQLDTEPQNETIEDTIIDIINYSTYIYALWSNRK